MDLKEVKNNYTKEYKYQELFRSVDFSERQPKLSANTYFYVVHSGGHIYGNYNGYLGHMEQHMKKYPDHTLYWLEPESEWFVKFYETGEN